MPGTAWPVLTGRRETTGCHEAERGCKTLQGSRGSGPGHSGLDQGWLAEGTVGGRRKLTSVRRKPAVAASSRDTPGATRARRTRGRTGLPGWRAGWPGVRESGARGPEGQPPGNSGKSPALVPAPGPAVTKPDSGATYLPLRCPGRLVTARPPSSGSSCLCQLSRPRRGRRGPGHRADGFCRNRSGQLQAPGGPASHRGGRGGF